MIIRETPAEKAESRSQTSTPRNVSPRPRRKASHPLHEKLRHYLDKCSC